jgi:hypothetical protein
MAWAAESEAAVLEAVLVADFTEDARPIFAAFELVLLFLSS